MDGRLGKKTSDSSDAGSKDGRPRFYMLNCRNDWASQIFTQKAAQLSEGVHEGAQSGYIVSLLSSTFASVCVCDGPRACRAAARPLPLETGRPGCAVMATSANFQWAIGIRERRSRATQTSSLTFLLLLSLDYQVISSSSPEYTKFSTATVSTAPYATSTSTTPIPAAS